jgi:hypothetical protein
MRIIHPWQLFIHGKYSSTIYGDFRVVVPFFVKDLQFTKPTDTSLLVRIVLGVEFDIVQFSHYFAIFKLPCCNYCMVICVGQFVRPRF